MVSFIGFIFIYTLGGITFFPLIALLAFNYTKKETLSLHNNEEPEIQEIPPQNDIVKKGWIRLINQYQPKMPDLTHNGNGIMSTFTNNNNNESGKKGVFFGVLRHGTLFCFESEKQKEIVMILPMQDYQVSLFASPSIEQKLDGELYGRTTVVRLVPNGFKHDINLTTSATALSIDSVCTLPEEDITCHPSRILYLTCARNIDKEDWYFGLLDAHCMIHDNPKEGPHYVMMDTTRFDQKALEKLIHQVQSTPNQRDMAWLNAILGRVFLGTYKTEQLKTYFETKIRKKIDKTKRPTFLDEIHVRSVNVGNSAPVITDPKLLSLTADGEVIVEAKIEYAGGLTIEIETDFNWSYSSRMKPIRMHLVLAVTLKKLQGRLMFKIKAPPTNRYWIGFFEMPDMEWKITPVVADKQIKLNIVTNAIESRIREVMAETLVLPNMNDISFFVSEGKGGIFGEYKKVQVKRNSSNSVESIKSQRADSFHSVASSSSNKSESVIRETPTVPDSIVEKPHAMDALKLKNRGAESVSNLIPDHEQDLPPRTLEVSHSTPEMQQQQQHDNTSTIRRRSKPPSSEESDPSDTESVKSNYSSVLRKFTNLIPSDQPDMTKKQAIMNMAGSFLSKRNSRQQDQEPTTTTTSESKKEIYAQRMASMRKRVEEKFGTQHALPPVKPRRARAASESDNSVKPPLPPRKHSIHVDQRQQQQQQQQRMPVQINTEHVHDVTEEVDSMDGSENKSGQENASNRDTQDTQDHKENQHSDDTMDKLEHKDIQEKTDSQDKRDKLEHEGTREIIDSQDTKNNQDHQDIQKKSDNEDKVDKPEDLAIISPPPLPSTPRPKRASAIVEDIDVKPPAIPPRSPIQQHAIPPNVPPRPH